MGRREEGDIFLPNGHSAQLALDWPRSVYWGLDGIVIHSGLVKRQCSSDGAVGAERPLLSLCADKMACSQKTADIASR